MTLTKAQRNALVNMFGGRNECYAQIAREDLKIRLTTINALVAGGMMTIRRANAFSPALYTITGAGIVACYELLMPR